MKTLSFKDELARQYTGTPRTTYLYRVRHTGELIGIDMCLGEKLDREMAGGFLTLPDGTEAARAFEEELAKDGLAPRRKTSSHRYARWPMVSVRAGVNPDQADDLRAFWQERGITGCEVLPSGDVQWDSRAARKKDCEAREMYDRDGTYGDPQPNNV